MDGWMDGWGYSDVNQGAHNQAVFVSFIYLCSSHTTVQSTEVFCM